MKQTIAVKLEPSQEQHDALLATMEAFNHGCGYVAGVAFEKRIANKIALQPFVYGQLRAQFGLSSQMAVRCIAKTVEAYKRDKNIRPTFAPHGAIVLDDRLMSFKGLSHVSLLTLGGRILVPMRFGAYQEGRIGLAKGQADLVYRNGRFFLYLTIDLPSPPPIDTQDVLGVDLGIVNIAVDSDGEAHTGEAVSKCRRRYARLRQGLQSCGSKSAKRHLRRIRKRESRFVAWVNHNVSKHIVQKAYQEQKTLALEDLTHINQRSTVRKAQRYERLSWAFRQLRDYIAYKAETVGLPCVFVDPRNTSRTCPACGHCEKANRISQSSFHCKHCGFEANADAVGATNIRRKGLEARGILSCPMDAVLSPA